MPRVPAVLSVVAAVLLGVLAVGRAANATAQDGTPTAGTPAAAGIELAPGLVAEVFAGVPSDRAPGQTLYVVRFTFQPGSEISPHRHPGTTVLAVESGALGWTLLEGTAHVVRGAAAGGTATEDVTEPGTEVLLNPGDAIYYEDDVVHTARNAGDGPLVLLSAFVLEAGQPLLMPAGTPMAGMEMATPAA